ncbi:hypothetical protein DFH06DRAFT_1239276 [Mycena polygramma]|nr:hypothetical protein DFH06DRAFT_1239276 [Mycena polygramma]
MYIFGQTMPKDLQPSSIAAPLLPDPATGPRDCIRSSISSPGRPLHLTAIPDSIRTARASRSFITRVQHSGDDHPNTLIVFGSSPDSYFIGHGRRRVVENMSLHSNANICKDLRDHLSGTNGKASVEFVSFPDDEDASHFFVKGKNPGVWNAILNDYFVQHLVGKQAAVPNFDAGITGMLFGKGKTYIVMFRGGFGADFDEDEVTTEDHPLYKVLAQYAQGWCIERGSTLCFYDSRYFYLKFKKPGDSRTTMHWNLPPKLAEQFQQLREEAQKPEEQIALMQDERVWMQVAQMRRNNQMQRTNTVLNRMNSASVNRTVTVRVISGVN